MKNTLFFAVMMLFIVTGVVAQTAAEAPQLVVETMYILPKRGMEEKFENALKAHNNKFHPAGPYVAGLRKVEYGDKAGWYVFVYGPTTYDKLDSRPAKENGHADDWSTNVDPLIEEYGSTSLWNYNSSLSYGFDLLGKSKYYEVWTVDIERGQYYRFKALVEKLLKAHESIGKGAFLVFNNPLHQADGPDVGLVWSFDSYKEWNDDMGLQAAVEKLYGKGSWQNLMDEWMDILVDYNSEIRSLVK